MKVPGSDAADIKISRSSEARTGEQKGVRRSVVGDGSQDAASQGLASKSSADTIRVSSLGTLLKSELNPAKIAEERAQKIAALKEQIANGTYAPDSQAVARSLSEEIFLEVAQGVGWKD